MQAKKKQPLVAAIFTPTRTLFTLASLLTALSLTNAAPARAVQCGDTITTDTVLEQSITCNSFPALTVQGSAILDLNGHTVVCTGTSSSGIGLMGRRAAVRNGTVFGCNVGVALYGKGSHKVENLYVLNSTKWAFWASSHSHRNKLENNVADQWFPTEEDAQGFRISSDRNTLTNNVVHGHITGFFIQGLRNTLRSNLAVRNYDGFVLTGKKHLLKENRSISNYAHGMLLNPGQGYTLSENQVVGNHEGIEENGSTGSKIEKNSVLGGGTGVTDSMGGQEGDCAMWKDNIYTTSYGNCF